MLDIIRFAWIALAVVIMGGLLAACGGGDDDPEPTNAPIEAPTIAPTPTIDPAAPITPQALTAENSLTISDGVCTAMIPAGWVDDGTGRGTSLTGNRFVLFGGRVGTDAEWDQAVALVESQATGNEGASVEKAADSILVTLSENLGFEFRKRFDAVYCDFTVTSAKGPIPPDERIYWNAIQESLRPIQ